MELIEKNKLLRSQDTYINNLAEFIKEIEKTIIDILSKLSHVPD